MSSSPSSSPTFSSSIGHPNIDWVDVLGHFLDNQPSDKPVVPAPSHPDAGSHVIVKEQPTTGAVPNPVSRDADVTQTVASPNVAIIVTTTDTNPHEVTVQKPEDENVTAEKARIRSERKRSREKQRRSDVNTQFADLTALLKKVEAEDVQSDENRKAFVKELSTASSNNMNRVDLIGKTITVLNRVHNENLKRKRTIDELNEELKVTKKRAEEATSELQQKHSNSSGGEQSNPMMMMVPMMMRPDGTPQAPFMPQTMPFYSMCQPNMPEKPSVATPASFASMYNPFMFGKQFSGSQQSSSGNQNDSRIESSGSSEQQFVPAMVQAPIESNGESLAHCA